jgi:CP family cyanate transporter-like MFS transporter
MNVLLPSMVKRRDPARAGLLIGIYLLSLSAGSILSSLIAIPSTASDGSARLTLGLWALPAIAAAVAWPPDPAAAASLSAFAQGARYLVTRPRARSPSGSCTPPPAVGQSR